MTTPTNPADRNREAEARAEHEADCKALFAEEGREDYDDDEAEGFFVDADPRDRTARAVPISQLPADQTAELVAAVRSHALDHYEADGWDFIVECWEDREIVEAMGNATTPDQAIERIRRAAGALDEQRREAQSAGGW